MDILLIHGYNVTSTKTYGVLPYRLKRLGHRVKDVYLSKYVTLDNDVTLPDIIRAFQSALKDVYGEQFGKRKFACVTHSTGGLVARGWIDAYYSDSMDVLPMSHLIMLAPPNNGSALATLGKSRLSRLRGYIGTEPGVRVLNGLELGSAYQWDLNTAWIKTKRHAAAHFYPAVITGDWIDAKFYDVLVPATKERGSDGVVRAASANLNMQKLTVSEEGSIRRESMGGIPFLITPKTSHSDETFGIMGSVPKEGHHPVLDAIARILAVNSRRDYQRVESDLALQTARHQRRTLYFDKSKLHRYVQLIFRIRDQMGDSLDDYAIEFKHPAKSNDQFYSSCVADKHKNAVNKENFIFYLDYDVLNQEMGNKVGVYVSCETGSSLIDYEPARFDLNLSGGPVHVRPNQTTYVEVVMRRRLNKNLFRLTKNFTRQKITGKPGPSWIN